MKYDIIIKTFIWFQVYTARSAKATKQRTGVVFRFPLNRKVYRMYFTGEIENVFYHV